MGFSVITTVLSAAASRDLTDLATVKDELDIKANNTTKDVWLARAITQVSRAIARHCKRPFVPELLRDSFDIEQDPYPYQTPGGFAKLVLSCWPVLSLTSVVQTLALNTTQVLAQDVDFRLDAKTGELLRLNRFTGVVTQWEAVPVTVVYAAGFGAIVQESHSVPASPYQVTVDASETFSCDVALFYDDGTPLVRVDGAPAQGQYSVDGGVYTFNAADSAEALTFTYATANVPPDLVDICLQLITARYASKGRDPSLVQQDTPGIGLQRWWFGSVPGQTGAFAPDIEAVLDDYRVPTVA